MPTDSCEWFHECINCHTLLKPKPGDCCVFCSYGSVPCPPIQTQGTSSSTEGVCWTVNQSNNTLLRWTTLFATSSTLLCCALPVVLVSLGFGATVASLNYNIPGLLLLAENKFLTLYISAFLLLILAWVIWRPNQACPTDPVLAELCQKAKHWNQRIFWISVSIWGIGFFFSYLLLPLRQTLG